MKRMVFRSVANLTDDDPVEIYWLAGFHRTENNEWKVRTVYRSKRTGELMPVLEPIGMLPMLSLGIWFDHGVLRTDALPGELGETVIPNVGEPEILTSAELPPELYAFPEGRAGNQRLLRYRTAMGDVLIPAIELVRALFVHNRALALALMRPAGLEQLIVPMEPGHGDVATLKFTKEMPQSSIGHDLAMNVAWTALEGDARRAWDSVLRLSEGQNYVLLEPPPIRNSVWTFRGIQHGNQWLVLELQYVGGREVPFQALEYTHPGFRKAIRIGSESRKDAGVRQATRPGKGSPPTKDYDVDDGEGGSTSYRGAQVAELVRPKAAFKSNIKVVKLQKDVERKTGEGSSDRRRLPRDKGSQTIQVTTGERAGKAKLPPLEFKTIALAPLARIGDLEALDETVRYMRDRLPDTHFFMGLVELRRGRAAASVGSSARVAMVVTIRSPRKPPIVVIDMERSGIAALSLMSMHFSVGTTEDQLESAVQMMLDSWAESGGSWSSEVEKELVGRCECLRLPKVLVPRGYFAEFAKGWASRLMQKLGLVD